MLLLALNSDGWDGMSATCLLLEIPILWLCMPTVKEIKHRRMWVVCYVVSYHIILCHCYRIVYDIIVCYMTFAVLSDLRRSDGRA